MAEAKTGNYCASIPRRESRVEPGAICSGNALGQIPARRPGGISAIFMEIEVHCDNQIRGKYIVNWSVQIAGMVVQHSLGSEERTNACADYL